MRSIIALFLMLFLGACAVTQNSIIYGDGSKPIKLSRTMSSRLAQEQLQQINVIRDRQGLSPLIISKPLIKAAEIHAKDMSFQQRPWHFGSDGSSPLERVQRAKYTGHFRGENIAETFEGANYTLRAWLTEKMTSARILDPDAREFGLGFYQERGGKIWWVQLFGA